MFVFSFESEINVAENLGVLLPLLLPKKITERARWLRCQICCDQMLSWFIVPALYTKCCVAINSESHRIVTKRARSHGEEQDGRHSVGLFVRSAALSWSN